MNKSLISLIIIFFSFQIADSAERYSLFKVKGDVAIKNNGKWIKASKNSELNLLDSLSIPKEASVSILDTKTNHIYRSISDGRFTVKALMDASKKQSQNSIKNIMAEISERIPEKQKNSGLYSNTGVTYRRQIKMDSITISLSDALIAISKASGEILMNNTSPISASKIFDEENDGTFFINICNNSSEPFLINVLQINNQTGALQPLMDHGYPRIIAIPSEPLILPIEIADSSIFKYLLFATTNDYDSALLEYLLKKPQDDKSKGTINNPVICSWIE